MGIPLPILSSVFTHSFDQNAALGAHMYVLEDGLELPESSGPHVEEEGEVFGGMDAHGCTAIEESKIQGRSGRAGAKFQERGYDLVMPALFRRTPGLRRRDCQTSAEYLGKQYPEMKPILERAMAKYEEESRAVAADKLPIPSAPDTAQTRAQVPGDTVRITMRWAKGQ
jgi:hypothetical protein